MGEDISVDAALTRRDVARAFGCRSHDDGTVSEVIDVDPVHPRYRERAAEGGNTWWCRVCAGDGNCECCRGMGVHWPGEGCWA